jgi:hypothetical protein
MKTCTVLTGKAWGGWYTPAAIFFKIGLLIEGTIMEVVRILLNYMEDLAEIGPRPGIRWTKERKGPHRRKGNSAKVWKEPMVSIYVGVILAIVLASAVRIWLDR